MGEGDGASGGILKSGVKAQDKVFEMFVGILSSISIICSLMKEIFRFWSVVLCLG